MSTIAPRPRVSDRTISATNPDVAATASTSVTQQASGSQRVAAPDNARQDAQYRSTVREDLDRALRSLITMNPSSLTAFAPLVSAALARGNEGDDAPRIELRLPSGEPAHLDVCALQRLAHACEQQLGMLELRESLMQPRTTRELAALSAEAQQALQRASARGDTWVRLPSGRVASVPSAAIQALRPMIERMYRIAEQREGRAEIEALHVNIEISLGIARMFPLLGGTISAIEIARQRTMTGERLGVLGNVLAVLSIAGDIAQLGRMAITGMRAQELALAVADSGATLRQTISALSHLSPSEVDELMQIARTMRENWNNTAGEALLASEQARAATLLRRGGLNIIVEGPNAGAIHAGRTLRGLAPEAAVAAQATETRNLAPLINGESQFQSVNDMRAVASAGERPPVFWEPSSSVLSPGEGASIWGQIMASSRGTLRDRIETLLHEHVHRWLTSYGPSRIDAWRTEFARHANDHVQLLRYLEETLAQGGALLRTRGIRSLPDVLQFPFVEGYQLRLSVVAAQGVAAAAVVAGAHELGTVRVGPWLYRVFFERETTAGTTAGASANAHPTRGPST